MVTKYWWANQKTRWRPERTLGHVFAPLPESSTQYQQGWENVRHLRPGHIIVHNVGSKIVAVSRVASDPVEAMRPTLQDETETERSVACYRCRGNLVEVDYSDVEPAIRVRDIPLDWRTPKTGPFSDSPKTMGRPEQIYLALLSQEFLEKLKSNYRERWPEGF